MRTTILSLITACLLLMGCGGGGGGGGGSSGSERPPLPDEVELSISPFNEGLHIQWHNLPAIERAGGIYIYLNLTSNDSPPELLRERIAIEDLTDNDNRYELDDLSNGTAYRLVGVAIELAGNISRVIDIGWLWEENEEDNNNNGIVVGANYDDDWRANSVDTDDDNDNKSDGVDACRLGEIGWNSDNTTLDYDSDGCRNDEDLDGDNDGVLNENEAEGCELNPNCDNDDLGDSEDACPAGLNDWSNNGTNDFDGDGCRNDEDLDGDNDGILNEDEEAGCSLTVDCDGDSLTDDYPTERLKNMDGVSCSVLEDCDNDNSIDTVDIDDDGDGLIEIKTAAELDAVRYVLNGIGFKANEEAVLDQTGCGNSSAITDCSGYELVDNISLSDHIARTNATAGWKPIASDTDGSRDDCQGGSWTAIFDGNGFEISGLFINRSQQDCIGLFAHATGTIRHLGVVADKVEGRDYVGGLVGNGESASIIQSYAVSNSVSGDGRVGGLAGLGISATIVQSYAVSDSVSGAGDRVGGLVGIGESTSIIQSYAVSNSVSGGAHIGGLVGWGTTASIVQSYAVSGSLSSTSSLIGGLVGNGVAISIVQSYAVSGSLSGISSVGGLVGDGTPASIITSYWDTETSGTPTSAAGDGQTRDALRSPTDYTGIYAAWDDGAMIDGINVNTTIWCDEDASGMIEDDERRDDSHTNGDNRVWDFGGTTDYPAIRCTPDSLADQRAWWHLNATGQPELNQTRLDAYLDGSLP